MFVRISFLFQCIKFVQLFWNALYANTIFLRFPRFLLLLLPSVQVRCPSLFLFRTDLASLSCLFLKLAKSLRDPTNLYSKTNPPWYYVRPYFFCQFMVPLSQESTLSWHDQAHCRAQKPSFAIFYDLESLYTEIFMFILTRWMPR